MRFPQCFFRPRLEYAIFSSAIKTESRADVFKTANMAEGLPKPKLTLADLDEEPKTPVLDLVSDGDEEKDDNEYWSEDEPLVEEPAWGAQEEEQDDVYRRWVGSKRSRPAFQEWRTSQVADPAQLKPDLGIYFNQFVLDDHSQIAICRAYASYLAAKNRPNGGVRGAYKKRTLGTKLQ